MNESDRARGAILMAISILFWVGAMWIAIVSKAEANKDRFLPKTASQAEMELIEARSLPHTGRDAHFEAGPKPCLDVPPPQPHSVIPSGTDPCD